MYYNSIYSLSTLLSKSYFALISKSKLKRKSSPVCPQNQVPFAVEYTLRKLSEYICLFISISAVATTFIKSLSSTSTMVESRPRDIAIAKNTLFIKLLSDAP